MAGTFGDGASNTSVRTGGHTGRPYGPASGFLVGAGFMPARNQVPIPAGVRWFRLVGADAHIGPYGVRASDTSVRVGGYKIRPYGPASGFPVGAACMAARTGSRFP